MTTATKYKSYPKYKPAGTDWPGKIPAGWEIKRFRFLANLQKGKKPDENTASVDGLPYLTMDYLRGQEEPTKYEPSTESVVVDAGETLLLWDGANAGEFVKSNRGILSSTMAKISFDKRKVNQKYYFYFLKSFEKKLRELTIGMGIPHVSGDIIKDCITPIPSDTEQQAIVDFLDRKTEVVDSVIEKKQKLIELLREKRQALITRAVTKGLNPKAKMKPSGIDWLGDIPEEWEVRKLKNISQIILGKMLQNEDGGGDFYRPYLKAQNIRWETVDVSDVQQMWFSKAETNDYRVYLHDLLVSEGGEVGRTAVWNNEIDECYVQNSVHIVRANKQKVDYKYLLYFLEALGHGGVFTAIVNQVSIAHLTRDKLKEVFILCPNIKEQKSIADFLDQTTEKIDQAIQKIEHQIELIKEYRQALISNAVTGKIMIT